MSGRLTTHVLDTARGRPAAGVEIVLRRDGEIVARAITNADGRTDGPLLDGEGLVAGHYELTFSVGAYFGDADGFLGDVPVCFRIADASQHYHVPLLASPFAYSTYRGS
jgi:hydroxyisourate hydrolase